MKPSSTPARAPRSTRGRAFEAGGRLGDRFCRHLVSSMRNGALAIARDGMLVLINDEAYRILDLPRDPVGTGRHFSDTLRTHPEVVRVLAQAFDQSHLPNRAELTLKPSNLVIGYTLSHVVSDEGQTTGAALFFKDLTLVERAEERERLRDRLAAVGEMAAAIAHEVKNPLAGIEVMAGLLRRQLVDRSDLHGLLTDIINEAKMANAIVCEVLEFVRPIRLELDPTSVARVVSEAVTLAEQKFARGHTVVVTEIPPDLPPILGDHYQLCQVVTNLVLNGFEALDGRGTVRIRAAHVAATDATRPPAILLEVSDDGPGIAPQVVDRIFSPFFTTKAKGSGLGLAIVRKIMDAHDGRIDLSTSPDRGATFRLTLPVVSPGSLPL